MEILNDLKGLAPATEKIIPVGLTIGNFDGVHVGHRQLLKKIKDDCQKDGLKFVVVTFVPHPQKILQPEKEHFLLSSYEQRRNLLKEIGVDYLIEMNFTRDFSTLKPTEFLSKYLLPYPGLKKFYLGYDFAFGANKEGGHDLVSKLCKPLEVEVEIQPKFEFQDLIVSSSLIREKVLTGKVEDAKELLARPFHLEGVVIKGEGRGKKIGFPTANIQISRDLIVPERGVYVTRTIHKGMTYKSVTNIGFNPTFNSENNIHIESHLFDFSDDIYGEKLGIEFLHKLRDERKFPTVNDLILQIKADAEAARVYLEKK